MLKIQERMAPLEPEKHGNKRLLRPLNYGFAREVEVTPIGLSEVVPCSMWYPIFFAKSGEDFGIFVFLGTDKRNLFVNSDGSWKTGVIPAFLKSYPLSIRKEGNEYMVLVDERFLSEEEGEPLFEDGKPTPYLENLKTELTQLALDLEKAQEFSREMLETGLLQPLNVEQAFSFGTLSLRNALTANMQAFIKIQPEKLYHLNIKGYLSLLFAQNFSLRNFALFELFISFEGVLPF